MGNRAHCKGCYYYRKLAPDGFFSDMVCHFAIDTPFVRQTPADECPYYTPIKRAGMKNEKQREGGKKGKRKE